MDGKSDGVWALCQRNNNSSVCVIDMEWHDPLESPQAFLQPYRLDPSVKAYGLTVCVMDFLLLPLSSPLLRGALVRRRCLCGRDRRLTGFA